MMEKFSESIAPLTGNIKEITFESPMQRAARLGVPYIEPIRPPESDIVAVCGQCGRNVQRVESYCCANSKCPIQPQILCG